MPRPTQTKLYHFTHVDNLATVLTQGLWCDAEMQGSSLLAKEVGDRAVKDRRRSLPVGAGAGGVTADYVPFYFAPRSPMMYVISKGGVPEYTGGLDPLIYLITIPELLQAHDCQCVISDGNCASTITRFGEDPAFLDTTIDWDLMRERYWHNTPEDGDRMRRRAAEFLVHRHVPASAIHSLATRNTRMLERVQRLLVEHSVELPATVEADWYY